MEDEMKYDIGYKFWVVKSQWLQRERKVDENSITWERVYPNKREYYIVDAEIVGSMTVTIQGHSLWDDEPFYDQYAVKYSDGFTDTLSDDDMEGSDWSIFDIFHSREEAEEFIAAKMQSES